MKPETAKTIVWVAMFALFGVVFISHEIMLSKQTMRINELEEDNLKTESVVLDYGDFKDAVIGTGLVYVSSWLSSSPYGPSFRYSYKKDFVLEHELLLKHLNLELYRQKVDDVKLKEIGKEPKDKLVESSAAGGNFYKGNGLFFTEVLYVIDDKIDFDNGHYWDAIFYVHDDFRFGERVQVSADDYSKSCYQKITRKEAMKMIKKSLKQ